MPQDDTETRDPEEIRRERENQARDANSRQNASRISRMEGIADNAEQEADHIGDEPLTDEMIKALESGELTEEQVNARAIAKAMANSEEGEEEDSESTEIRDASPRNNQEAEAEDDTAREAGADDVRVVDGVKEYRIVVNGQERWRTLSQIKADAQKVESADEYLQTAADTARRTASAARPSSEETRQAAEQEKQTRLTKRKELLRRVALGDEQAIDELAELDESRVAPSVVTPDTLRALDERFDARVTFRDAVNWFEGEYASELAHPAMKIYAGQLDVAIVQKATDEGREVPSPKARLRQVGEQIRRELKERYGYTGKQAGPSDKAIRKAEGARRPVPASARQPNREADEGEGETTQDAIQSMARARHQPRAVVHAPVRSR